LECLPNEILLQIHEYFDAQDLYDIFFNINARFNHLLQSSSYLCLRFQSLTDQIIVDSSPIFAAQLYSLNIHSQESILISSFTNIHRLTICYPTDEQLSQINAQSFPNLEYLSVTYTVAKSSICSLYQKIFSNHFTQLKFCFLYGREVPRKTLDWTRSPHLEHVHVTSNYSTILDVCPNLSVLHLSLPKFPRHVISPVPHHHMKHLRLILTSIIWSEDEQYFRILFSSMPYLERFSLHKIFSLTNTIDLLLQYDWLSSLLSDYLPCLKEFRYYLYVLNLFDIDRTEFDRALSTIEQSFARIYLNRTNFRLKIKEYTSS
jgi:hypothetical protein